VLIRDPDRSDLNRHPSPSPRSNYPDNGGGALQTPRREGRISREFHDDADPVMRAEAPMELSGVKFHEDSRAADIDYRAGKRQFPCRDRAQAAPQPQTEAVSPPPFQRATFGDGGELLVPSHGPD
jgi:hypothetical protein